MQALRSTILLQAWSRAYIALPYNLSWYCLQNVYKQTSNASDDIKQLFSFQQLQWYATFTKTYYVLPTNRWLYKQFVLPAPKFNQI